MSAIAEARALVSTLSTELADTDLFVTIDPAEAGGYLGAGDAVLVIGPPERDYRATAVPEYSWEALLAAGPHTDRVEAWERLDILLDRLEDLPQAINITSATPATMTPLSGSTYEFSAYIIRFQS